MRHYIYKDINIPKREYNKVLKDYKDFHTATSGLVLDYTTVDYDFKDYPTVTDTDGLQRPTRAFLKEMVAKVEKRLGKYGTDHIKLLIHEDNWKSDPDGPDGIWGTSWTYTYGNYNLCYDRWDKDNPANSLGTINHEDDHSYDSIVKTEIGIDINKVLGTKDYDAQSTHGGRYTDLPAYHGYLRYKENRAKLKVLAPYLQASYAKRLERHTEAIRGMQMTVIGLLEQLVYLYQKRLNRKSTITK
jgi:hypothetical protein